MPKTINYPLAKKLYDAGVVIESEQYYNDKGCVISRFDYEYATLKHMITAPNCEEVIEFLKSQRICLLIKATQIYSVQFIINFEIDSGIFARDTLLEALEATLEYLLDNGYIGNTKN